LQAPGAEHLAAGLRFNNALQVLSLAGNRVQAAGCIAIADALRANEVLQELDLSSNGIPSSACLSIAHMLSENMMLEILALRRNPLGERGGQVILQAAGASKWLKKVDLEGANFATHGRHDTDVPFNPLNPSGQYRLDLSGAALVICSLMTTFLLVSTVIPG
jgi:Ran GTPase-activating protein (RanGAP) involved in mRNA processing and transport